jgi:hypothetical protein
MRRLLVLLVFLGLSVGVQARVKSSYVMFFGNCNSITGITSGQPAFLFAAPGCVAGSSSGYPNGVLMPSPGTLSNLWISGYAGVYTVYVNNSASALTCTIGTGSYDTEYPQCAMTVPTTLM